ncbi:hypothetical protein CAP35_12485 [Chitinophagaceae bacterium IBVUCB1]|nr:hypothetical protein CAP35_12485 [Chitinophagaceae bacterium IBVUCB1]
MSEILTLLSNQQLTQLLNNANDSKNYLKQIPIIKLFLPGTSDFWLATGLYNDSRCFGFYQYQNRSHIGEFDLNKLDLIIGAKLTDQYSSTIFKVDELNEPKVVLDHLFTTSFTLQEYIVYYGFTNKKAGPRTGQPL